jgi:hypothetical protein
MTGIDLSFCFALVMMIQFCTICERVIKAFDSGMNNITSMAAKTLHQTKFSILRYWTQPVGAR